jgi:hypothetical protein
MILYIIIFFIILFILYRNIILVEGYDKWELKIFNMNWNKPWKENEVAYNNPYPQDIPRSSNNDPTFPNYILEIVKEYNLKEILSKMIESDYKINNIKPIDLSWENKYFLRKNTWYNDINELTTQSLKIDTPRSCVIQVNKVLEDFMKQFNINFSNQKSEKFIREFYGDHPFKIYKFKIHKIAQLDTKQEKPPYQSCIYRYGLIVVIIREDSYVGITLYLDIVIKDNTPHLIYYDIIGYYTTDKLFLPEGVREVGQKKYYQLKPLYRLSKNDRTLNEYVNDDNWKFLNVNAYNAEKILWKQKQYALDNTLHQQHTCFNAEPEYYNPSGVPPVSPGAQTQPILTHVYNKYNCESKYDQQGRRKPKGKWDKPCKFDQECVFYGKNRNYPNIFGGCNKRTGFCELPRGMKNLSYHDFYPFDQRNIKDMTIPIANPNQGNPAPLCYNCKSVNKTNKWQPVTALDQCCHDQRNKDVYPHLNGPDYAYRGDTATRLNIFRKENN